MSARERTAADVHSRSLMHSARSESVAESPVCGREPCRFGLSRRFEKPSIGNLAFGSLCQLDISVSRCLGSRILPKQGHGIDVIVKESFLVIILPLNWFVLAPFDVQLVACPSDCQEESQPRNRFAVRPENIVVLHRPRWQLSYISDHRVNTELQCARTLISTSDNDIDSGHEKKDSTTYTNELDLTTTIAIPTYSIRTERDHAGFGNSHMLNNQTSTAWIIQHLVETSQISIMLHRPHRPIHWTHTAPLVDCS